MFRQTTNHQLDGQSNNLSFVDTLHATYLQQPTQYLAKNIAGFDHDTLLFKTLFQKNPHCCPRSMIINECRYVACNVSTFIPYLAIIRRFLVSYLSLNNLENLINKI